MSHNIQQLFSRIRAFQVRTYLVQKGWTVTSEDDDEVMRFQGPLHGGGQPYELAIWASDKERRFRNRVPNIVFMLSEVEKRHPREIAQDISELRKPTPPPAEPSAEAGAATTAAASIRFRNEQSEPISVARAGRGDAFPLAAGETVQVIAGSSQSPCLVLKEGRLDVESADAASIRLVFVVDSPVADLRQLIEMKLGADTLADAPSIQGVLDRAEFELSAEGERPSVAACQRQAAVVITPLAQQLEPEAGGALWRIAATMIQRSGSGLELGGDGELFQVARGDNPDAPVSVLKWLAARTVNSGELSG